MREKLLKSTLLKRQPIHPEEILSKNVIPTPGLSASEAARRQCDICRAVPIVSVIADITLSRDGDGVQTSRSIIFVGKGNVVRDCCKIKDLTPFFARS